MNRKPTPEEISCIWPEFLNSIAKQILKEVLDHTLAIELTGFEHIKPEEFEAQKARVAGLRMALGHINMPTSKVLASLYPDLNK